jgi:Family of unknown function (DUF5317)
VFILYAIPLGLIAGLAIGGRLGGLATLQFRWVWLAVAGLVLQVALFSEPLGSSVGAAGPALYVASNVAVLVAVLHNLAIPVMPLIAAGAGCNLVAILANGGAMPADPSAVFAAGIDTAGHTNSVDTAEPAFRLLTDIFALPAWLPFANVFSIGDLFIAAGVAATVALAMRSGARQEATRA